MSLERERLLAAHLAAEPVSSDLIRLLACYANDDTAPPPIRRFAILVLGARGEIEALRKALLGDQSTLIEAALNAIDWWSIPRCEAELSVVAYGEGPDWLRDYAKDLLG